MDLIAVETNITGHCVIAECMSVVIYWMLIELWQSKINMEDNRQYNCNAVHYINVTIIWNIY